MQLVIGPLIYAVDHVSGDDNSPWGEVKYAQQRITVLDSLTAGQQWITLWHEIIHAVLVQAGHEKLQGNEDLMNALSHGLVQVLMDNSELVAMIPDYARLARAGTIIVP